MSCIDFNILRVFFVVIYLWTCAGVAVVFYLVKDKDYTRLEVKVAINIFIEIIEPLLVDTHMAGTRHLC